MNIKLKYLIINNKSMVSKKKFLAINALAGIILIVLTSLFLNNKETFIHSESLKAAQIMKRSIDIVSYHCMKNNINYDLF